MVRFQMEGKIFCLLKTIQTGCGAHPYSTRQVPRVLSSEVRELECEADQSSLSSVEDKNAWRCTSTRSTPSWRAQGKFTFTFVALNVRKRFGRTINLEVLSEYFL